MSVKEFSFKNLHLYSALIEDFLDQKSSIENLISGFSTVDFVPKIIEQRNQYPIDRNILVEELSSQYNRWGRWSEGIDRQLHKLSQENTFTITTGHQLNLMGGPAYMIYKIAQVIAVTDKLNREFPDYQFIPIYWMATEDHDFEEINHFYFGDKKYHWDIENQNIPTGRIPIDNHLRSLLQNFLKDQEKSSNYEYLKNLIETSYLVSNNLAEAHFKMIHEIFKNSELLILDADNAGLKNQLIPAIQADVLQKATLDIVDQTIRDNFIPYHYKVQVNPRECNYFFIEDGKRKRIIAQGEEYLLDQSSTHWNASEMLTMIKKSPELFSPNVLQRPLYQEMVLPNLMYVGGAAEVSYWLELKALFDYSKISFPLLTVRNSWQFIDKEQWKEMKNLGIEFEDLFLSKLDFEEKSLHWSVIKNSYQDEIDSMLKPLYQWMHKELESNHKEAIIEITNTKMQKGVDYFLKKLRNSKGLSLDEKWRNLERLKKNTGTQPLQERRQNYFSIASPEYLNSELIISNSYSFESKYLVFLR